MNKSKVAITMGDPAGVGPEIVVKAINNKEIRELAKLIVVGDRSVLEKALEITNVNLNINIIHDIKDYEYVEDSINLIDLENVDIDKLIRGIVQGHAGKASYEYIDLAIKLALDEYVDAVVTTPINKKALKAAGVKHIGHTEIFAELTNTKDPLTMFQVLNLKVFFLSRHLSLIEACKVVTKERVIDYIYRSLKALKRLGVKSPKLAVAGLNPHSGEGGLFGNEEIEEIAPAIKEARKKGLDVEGPISADAVFHMGLIGKYDAVLSLYHDQGHIATKMVDFERTISITNNMPFIRTSVDHGTAYDIAGTGKASSVSMEEAIKLAVEYAPLFKK